MAPFEKELNLNSCEVCPDSKDQAAEEQSEGSWFESSAKLFEELRRQMETVQSMEKDVKMVAEDLTENQILLEFDLVGLKPGDLKVSMTESNFLEVEESVDSSEGPSSIWAFPLGKGFKNQEVKADYPEESKLVITVPKDPDFQPAEDATDQTPEPHELVAAELPESEDQDQVQVVPVQVLEPIQAEVTETEDSYCIELNIEDFEADDITVELSNSHVLKVSGERKKKPDQEQVLGQEPETGTEARVSRKSFGRMFWIPEGCDTEAIEATARKIYSILNLEIRIPKSGSEPVSEPVSDPEKDSRTIAIKLL